MSADTTEVKQHVEQVELKLTAESKRSQEKKESKELVEGRTILLSDIPGIENYLPEEVDLAVPIDAPLMNKEGAHFSFGSSALIYAIRELLNPDLVELLLHHGANPNILGITIHSQNVTALMFAITSMSRKTIEVLLKHGADFLLKDSNGYTAIDWATHWNEPFERERNFKLNLIDPDMAPHGGLSNHNNFTPLLVAIYQSDHLKSSIQNALAQCGTNLIPSICRLVAQYSFEIADVSKALQDKPRHIQFQFLGMLQRAYTNYIKEKKLAKITSFTDEELDFLHAEYNKSQDERLKAMSGNASGVHSTGAGGKAPLAITYQYASSSCSAAGSAAEPQITETVSAHLATTDAKKSGLGLL